MSQLLDSLRRQGRTAPRRAPSPSVTGDAVLATLGYAPPRGSTIARRAGGMIVVLALVATGLYVWAWFRDEPIQRVAQPTTSKQAAPAALPPAAGAPFGSAGEPATPTMPASKVPRAANPMFHAAPADTTPAQPVVTARQAPKPPLSTPAVAKPEPRKPAPFSPPVAVTPPTAAVPAVPPDTGLVSPAADHWTQALYYQKDGDFDNAMKHYAALLGKEPMNAQVRNNLGMLYQQRGMLDQAVREFQRALNIDPRYVRAHNNLGVAYLAQRNVDAAAAQFREALEIDRRNVDAMVNLSIADKALGQRERAKEGLLRALNIDPRSAAAHYNLGVLCDETGEAALAMQHYRWFLENANADYAARAVDVRARLDTLGRAR